MKKHDTRPTPETGALITLRSGFGVTDYEWRQHSRKLERERDELREANAAIQTREAALVLSKDRISKRAKAIRCGLVEKEKQVEALREELARMQTMAASVADTLALMPIEDVRPLVGMLEQTASWHPQASDFDKQCAKALDEFHAKHSLP